MSPASTSTSAAAAAGAGGDNQATKFGVEFRRAAGEVERGDIRAGGKKVDHRINCFGRHLLGAVGPSIDVTVQAALVAAVAEIDLKRFKFTTV